MLFLQKQIILRELHIIWKNIVRSIYCHIDILLLRDQNRNSRIGTQVALDFPNVIQWPVYIVGAKGSSSHGLIKLSRNIPALSTSLDELTKYALQKWANIGPGNCLSSGRLPAFTWSNVHWLSLGALGTNFEISITRQGFLVTKIYFKISPAYLGDFVPISMFLRTRLLTAVGNYPDIFLKNTKLFYMTLFCLGWEGPTKYKYVFLYVGDNTLKQFRSQTHKSATSTAMENYKLHHIIVRTIQD